MKYKEHASRFWDVCRYDRPSVHEVTLFFFLLDMWDRLGRVDTFICEPKQIELCIGLSKQTLDKCRKRLQSKGLIGYEKGNRRIKKPYYFLLPLTNSLTNTLTNMETSPKEKAPPTPPLKENIIKENSSNEELKKAELPSPTPTKQKSERMNWEAFKQTFNEMLSPPIPKVVDMTENRRQRVKAIIKDFGKDSIIQVYQLIQASDFLTGNNKSGWHCDFDWIFKKNNFLKILEGNYNNNRNGTENRRANYTSKQEVNEYAYNQFLAKRAAKEQGLVVEVENPF